MNEKVNRIHSNYSVANTRDLNKIESNYYKKKGEGGVNILVIQENRINTHTSIDHMPTAC